MMNIKVDILRNVSDIKHLDRYSYRFVYDNFGTDSECVYGLWLNNKIIGYCTLGYADGVLYNANADDLLLSDVYILSKYRNKGYGLYFLQRVLKNINVPVYAEILEDGLLYFYSKLGFKLISDGLLMRR